jgi:hypothetical protein
MAQQAQERESGDAPGEKVIIKFGHSLGIHLTPQQGGTVIEVKAIRQRTRATLHVDAKSFHEGVDALLATNTPATFGDTKNDKSFMVIREEERRGMPTYRVIVHADGEHIEYLGSNPEYVRSQLHEASKSLSIPPDDKGVYFA